MEIHYTNYELFFNLPEASLKFMLFPAHAVYMHTQRHTKRQYTDREVKRR